jgi:chaperonin GroES
MKLSAKNFAQAPCGQTSSPYLAAKRFRRRATSGGRFTPNVIPVQTSKEKPMKFRPLHDRVVVKRIDAEERTAGGIIIPDTAKEKPSQGEIIAVGPGGRDENGKLIPIDVRPGDRVLFGKWSGTEVKIDGIEYLIMKESDIMGVLEGTAAKKKAA